MPLDPNDFVEENLGDDDHHLATLLATMSKADFERIEPPTSVWAGIEQRLAADEADGSRYGTAQFQTTTQSPTVIDQAPVVVTSLDERRAESKIRKASTTPWLLAAAAVIVAVMATSAFLLRSQPSEELLASATLQQQEPLGSVSASAQLVEDPDGTTRLVIDTVDMPAAPEGESYELWLIDSDVTDPLSLGVVTGSGEVIVPSTIDPATHPVVDISLEPNDGDATHSGHSIMRGTLS